MAYLSRKNKKMLRGFESSDNVCIAELAIMLIAYNVAIVEEAKVKHAAISSEYPIESIAFHNKLMAERQGMLSWELIEQCSNIIKEYHKQYDEKYPDFLNDKCIALKVIFRSTVPDVLERLGSKVDAECIIDKYIESSVVEALFITR